MERRAGHLRPDSGDIERLTGRRNRMEIKIGNLKLTAEYKGIHGTYIILHKGEEEIVKVDSLELKAAIEALEKSCWRP